MKQEKEKQVSAESNADLTKEEEKKRKEKQELRREFKKRRVDMTAEEVSSLSEKICAHILRDPLFMEAEYILAYHPLGNEADIRQVVKEAWKQKKHVAFPKVFGDEMRFFEVESFAQLHPGCFGVMEPEETHPAEWENALMLTPGVAFDRNGGRMGFGKGYYDRYLSKYPECTTLGVSYELQVAEQIPTEPLDVPLAYLVTEKGKRGNDGL